MIDRTQQFPGTWDSQNIKSWVNPRLLVNSRCEIPDVSKHNLDKTSPDLDAECDRDSPNTDQSSHKESPLCDSSSLQLAQAHGGMSWPFCIELIRKARDTRVVLSAVTLHLGIFCIHLLSPSCPQHSGKDGSLPVLLKLFLLGGSNELITFPRPFAPRSNITLLQTEPSLFLPPLLFSHVHLETNRMRLA